MAKSSIRKIPFSRFVVVASAGLVGFLAFWQAFFSFTGYRPCALQNPDYVIPPNPNAAITELGICIIAMVVLFWGAKRLRTNFPEGFFGYSMVVVNLLIGEGLLAFVFLRLSTCAG